MSTKLKYASGLAVAVTFITTLISAEGSGAAAQSLPGTMAEPAAQIVVEPAPAAVPTPTPTPPAVAPTSESPAEPVAVEEQKPAASAAPEAELSREMHCLAGAIYFEAKGEPLPGQLAVGRVIVARSKSGRFPSSYCGVVFQPSQFSFVRGRAMPRIDKGSRAWATAVKMARAADAGSKSPAEGALFFHAARVSPGWRLKRVAQIENHVFYR